MMSKNGLKENFDGNGWLCLVKVLKEKWVSGDEIYDFVIN